MSENTDAPSYAERERRLDEILDRLERSEVSLDDLADEAREAAQLIASMHGTIRRTRGEIATILDELESTDDDAER